MCCRLWVMLMLITVRFESSLLVASSSSAFHHVEDCFYEKRLDTALHGYNYLHNRWISDFDCFDRCLRTDLQPCRSFEHWRSNQTGLCVRANLSLTDDPSAVGHNAFVDYYEIDCRQDVQAVVPEMIQCPKDQLSVTVKLNGIHPHDMSLGDSSCTPIWSNRTHAQFITKLDRCSLLVTNQSILGKLRWKTVHHNGKHYERFFLCSTHLANPSRLAHRASTHPYSFTTPPMHRRWSTANYPDEAHGTSPYRITLEWMLHNRSYHCPEACFISLYSFINITLDDLPLISSAFSIDSCDLKALYPYTQYLQSRRLIQHGCSIDPSIVQFVKPTAPLATVHFSFYLYHILKEPIPFQIQCKLLHQDILVKHSPGIDCSLSSTIDSSHDESVTLSKNTKRNQLYTVFRSSPVYVTRQLPSVGVEQEIFYNPNSSISIATVHSTGCSLFLLIFHAFWNRNFLERNNYIRI